MLKRWRLAGVRSHLLPAPRTSRDLFSHRDVARVLTCIAGAPRLLPSSARSRHIEMSSAASGPISPLAAVSPAVSLFLAPANHIQLTWFPYATLSLADSQFRSALSIYHAWLCHPSEYGQSPSPQEAPHPPGVARTLDVAHGALARFPSPQASLFEDADSETAFM